MLDFTPLWLSLRIATIATAIASVLGITAAHWRQQYQGRGRSLIDSLLLAPLVLPPTVLGFGLLLLLGKNGPLGSLLDRLGITVIFTSSAAILAATVVGLPLMYKTVLGALAQIDPTIPAAARTLGASEWRIFWQINLPLALPGLLAGVTLTFARTLGEFGATLMVAGNIPGQTQTLPMAIYFAVEAGQFRIAAFWTGCILLITLGGLLLVNSERIWVGPSLSWLPVKPAGFRRAGQARPTKMLRRVRLARLKWVRAGSASPLPIGNRGRSLGAQGRRDITDRGDRELTPQLSVRLIKQFPGFTLDVDLSSDRTPLGLLGASGAGKSLILRCIAGLETPDAGRIVLNGRVLFDSARGINLPSRERRVGILFQNYALFPHLSAAQNIAFGLPPGLSFRQRRRIVARQLAAMQLQDWDEGWDDGLLTAQGNRRPPQLSGGQQQRVALARLLASQPEALLLDEPFSALDTHLCDRLTQDLQQHLAQFSGVTLLVTHNITVAYQLCDRLLAIDRGQRVVSGPKDQVLQQPQTVAAARLTGCKNISPIAPVTAQTVKALAWDCLVQVATPQTAAITHLGLRAERIQVNDAARPTSKINTFPAWLTLTRATPEYRILYLKLHRPPQDEQDHHLQAHVSYDHWQQLQGVPLPWSVTLDATQLLLLRHN
ncbi:MAG: molybdate ABC transporter permease subunit [Spirulinaceae cyanobacterium]